MKKVVIALAGIGLLSSSLAVRAEHTVSIGYAQSKVQDFKNIRGVNLKYRYEWDSPISLLTSFSWMNGSNSLHEEGNYGAAERDNKVNYYSLTAGPAWRINQYISLYSQVGIAYSRITNQGESYYSHAGSSSSSSWEGSDNNASFVYGLGFQVNPVENISVDLGYEGSRLKAGNRHHSVNGFNLSVGYRF